MSDANFDNLDPVVAAGGNSSAARSLRVKSQLRDRFGRWIEMGRSTKVKIQLGMRTLSVIGKFVGGAEGRPGYGNFLVENDPNIPDGIYQFKGRAAERVLASLDIKDLEAQGLKLGQDVNKNSIGDVLDEDIENYDDIKREEIGELDKALAGGQLAKEEETIATLSRKEQPDSDYKSHNVIARTDATKEDATKGAEQVQEALAPSDSDMVRAGSLKAGDKVRVNGEIKTVKSVSSTDSGDMVSFTDRKFKIYDDYTPAEKMKSEEEPTKAVIPEEKPTESAIPTAETKAELERLYAPVAEDRSAVLAREMNEISNKVNNLEYEARQIRMYGTKSEANTARAEELERQADELIAQYEAKRTEYQALLPDTSAQDAIDNRQAVKDGIQWYDNKDGDLAKLIDSGADGEAVRAWLTTNSDAWNSAADDFKYAWAVDLPQPLQRERWKKFETLNGRIDKLESSTTTDKTIAELPSGERPEFKDVESSPELEAQAEELAQAAEQEPSFAERARNLVAQIRNGIKNRDSESVLRASNDLAVSARRQEDSMETAGEDLDTPEVSRLRDIRMFATSIVRGFKRFDKKEPDFDYELAGLEESFIEDVLPENSIPKSSSDDLGSVIGALRSNESLIDVTKLTNKQADLINSLKKGKKEAMDQMVIAASQDDIDGYNRAKLLATIYTDKINTVVNSLQQGGTGFESFGGIQNRIDNFHLIKESMKYGPGGGKDDGRTVLTDYDSIVIGKSGKPFLLRWSYATSTTRIYAINNGKPDLSRQLGFQTLGDGYGAWHWESSSDAYKRKVNGEIGVSTAYISVEDLASRNEGLGAYLTLSSQFALESAGRRYVHSSHLLPDGNRSSKYTNGHDPELHTPSQLERLMQVRGSKVMQIMQDIGWFKPREDGGGLSFYNYKGSFTRGSSRSFENVLADFDQTRYYDENGRVTSYGAMDSFAQEGMMFNLEEGIRQIGLRWASRNLTIADRENMPVIFKKFVRSRDKGIEDFALTSVLKELAFTDGISKQDAVIKLRAIADSLNGHDLPTDKVAGASSLNSMSVEIQTRINEYADALEASDFSDEDKIQRRKINTVEEIIPISADAYSEIDAEDDFPLVLGNGAKDIRLDTPDDLNGLPTAERIARAYSSEELTTAVEEAISSGSATVNLPGPSISTRKAFEALRLSNADANMVLAKSYDKLLGSDNTDNVDALNAIRSKGLKVRQEMVNVIDSLGADVPYVERNLPGSNWSVDARTLTPGSSIVTEANVPANDLSARIRPLHANEQLSLDIPNQDSINIGAPTEWSKEADWDSLDAEFEANGTISNSRTIARNFSTSALRSAYISAISKHQDSVRVVHKGKTTDVDIRAIRDALQMQGVNTNELIDSMPIAREQLRAIPSDLTSTRSVDFADGTTTDLTFGEDGQQRVRMLLRNEESTSPTVIKIVQYANAEDTVGINLAQVVRTEDGRYNVYYFGKNSSVSGDSVLENLTVTPIGNLSSRKSALQAIDQRLKSDLNITSGPISFSHPDETSGESATEVFFTDVPSTNSDTASITDVSIGLSGDTLRVITTNSGSVSIIQGGNAIAISEKYTPGVYQVRFKPAGAEIMQRYFSTQEDANNWLGEQISKSYAVDQNVVNRRLITTIEEPTTSVFERQGSATGEMSRIDFGTSPASEVRSYGRVVSSDGSLYAYNSLDRQPGTDSENLFVGNLLEVRVGQDTVPTLTTYGSYISRHDYAEFYVRRNADGKFTATVKTFKNAETVDSKEESFTTSEEAKAYVEDAIRNYTGASDLTPLVADHTATTVSPAPATPAEAPSAPAAFTTVVNGKDFTSRQSGSTLTFYTPDGNEAASIVKNVDGSYDIIDPFSGDKTNVRNYPAAVAGVNELITVLDDAGMYDDSEEAPTPSAPTPATTVPVTRAPSTPRNSTTITAQGRGERNAQLVLDAVKQAYPEHEVLPNGDIKVSSRDYQMRGRGDSRKFRYEVVLHKKPNQDFVAYTRSYEIDANGNRTGEVTTARLTKPSQSPVTTLKRVRKLLGTQTIGTGINGTNPAIWFNNSSDRQGEVKDPATGELIPESLVAGRESITYIAGTGIPATGDGTRDAMISRFADALSLVTTDEQAQNVADEIRRSWTNGRAGLSTSQLDDILERLVANRKSSGANMIPYPSSDGKTIVRVGDRVQHKNGRTGTVTKRIREIKYARNGVDYSYEDVVYVRYDNGPANQGSARLTTKNLTVLRRRDGSAPLPADSYEKASSSGNAVVKPAPKKPTWDNDVEGGAVAYLGTDGVAGVDQTDPPTISMIKNRNGKYMVTIQVNGNAKPITRVFDSQQEADSWANGGLQKIINGEDVG